MNPCGIISRIHGDFVGMDHDGAMVIEAGGIGYRCIVSDRDRPKINALGVGAAWTLFVRVIATEQDATIYGFTEEDDRTTFDAIRALDGCGVGTALRVLSVYSAEAFATIVKEKEVRLLKKIPGIGSKTALKLACGVA